MRKIKKPRKHDPCWERPHFPHTAGRGKGDHLTNRQRFMRNRLAREMFKAKG